MGGNGPHSGTRNSSFGLATLRRDGYAAVRASATTSDPSSFNPNLVTTSNYTPEPVIPISPPNPQLRPSAQTPDPLQVHGSGTFFTVKLKVTAPRLTATADFAGSMQTESETPP